MRAWERSRSAAVYRRPGKARRSSVPPVLVGLLLMGVAGIGYTADGISDRIRPMLPGSGCNIKGNVNRVTGERIYHVPGQKYYRATRISPPHADRWFCSEQEARRAGWRRSLI